MLLLVALLLAAAQTAPLPVVPAPVPAHTEAAPPKAEATRAPPADPAPAIAPADDRPDEPVPPPAAATPLAPEPGAAVPQGDADEPALLAHEVPLPAAAQGDVPVVVATTAPWYANLSIDAFLSVAYGVNALHFGFDRRNALRVFDGEQNTISIDLAELTTQVRAERAGDAGFKLRIGHGRAVPVALGGDDLALIEGLASYILPVGRGLRLDAGTFVSHMGTEVIETYDDVNPTFSRSLTFSLRPLRHTGLKASYTICDAVTVMALVADGRLANVAEDNDAKHLGARVTVMPRNDLELRVAWLGGVNGNTDRAPWQHFANLVALYEPLPTLDISLDLLLAMRSNADAGQSSWGAVATASYSPLAAFLVALRAEVAGGRARAPAGNAAALSDVPRDLTLLVLTLAPTWRPHDHVALRLEGRYDRVLRGGPFFESDSGPSNNQITAAVNALAYF